MENPTSKLDKIVVNSGFGRLATQPSFEEKTLPELMREFAALTGQKPAPRPARTSISGFKIRQGLVVGMTATLRGKRMADFLRRFIAVVLPRIRDFRGIPLQNVDARGNLNVGVREQFAFPEVTPETSKVNFGLQVTVVPKRVKNRDEAIALYRELGVPLQKKQK